MSDKPPLDDLTFEEIAQGRHSIDERYWPNIVAFRVANYYPLETPVPPQTPQKLLKIICEYAHMLFDIEARRYDQFSHHEHYSIWLRSLLQRVADHVIAAYENLDQADLKSTLAYHGLTRPKIGAALKERLQEVLDGHLWNSSLSVASRSLDPYQIDASEMRRRAEVHYRSIRDNDSSTLLQEATSSATSPSEEKKALLVAYQSAFPAAGILDICWAAEQGYREWSRWLKCDPKVKDGSKPDRAFRRVLTCGKDARIMRAELRPKGWK